MSKSQDIEVWQAVKRDCLDDPRLAHLAVMGLAPKSKAYPSPNMDSVRLDAIRSLFASAAQLRRLWMSAAGKPDFKESGAEVDLKLNYWMILQLAACLAAAERK